MRRVLVLRPEPGATATVQHARGLGLDAIAVPLFEVEAVAWTAPDSNHFDALLLTSANAVRFGGAELGSLRALPVYAVGEATAEAGRQAGLRIVGTGDEGVDRLLDMIPADLKLLHLCGEDRKAPSDARQAITPTTVYRAVEIDVPGLEVGPNAVALVHSPRAGRRFAELVKDRSTVAIAAISRAAAERTGTGWESVETADVPTDDALLALAARLCNKPASK
jgi:uroporphyrinogen-III synthase